MNYWLIFWGGVLDYVSAYILRCLVLKKYTLTYFFQQLFVGLSIGFIICNADEWAMQRVV